MTLWHILRIALGHVLVVSMRHVLWVARWHVVLEPWLHVRRIPWIHAGHPWPWRHLTLVWHHHPWTWGHLGHGLLCAGWSPIGRTGFCFCLGLLPFAFSWSPLSARLFRLRFFWRFQLVWVTFHRMLWAHLPVHLHLDPSLGVHLWRGAHAGDPLTWLDRGLHTTDLSIQASGHLTHTGQRVVPHTRHGVAHVRMHALHVGIGSRVLGVAWRPHPGVSGVSVMWGAHSLREVTPCRTWDCRSHGGR